MLVIVIMIDYSGKKTEAFEIQCSRVFEKRNNIKTEFFITYEYNRLSPLLAAWDVKAARSEDRRLYSQTKFFVNEFVWTGRKLFNTYSSSPNGL